MAGKYTAQTFVKIMSKIKPIAIRSENGNEYAFRFRRIFQSEKDKIDLELYEVVEESKYEDTFRIHLQAIAKHGTVEKLLKTPKAEKAEAVDVLKEFADFTVENETVIRAAFNYFTNNQSPSSRFLDE